MPDEYYILIKRFLNNELQDKELDEFYDRLNNDHELSERLAAEVARSHGRQQLKEKLKVIDKSIYSAKKRQLIVLRIAASMIVVLGAGIFYKYFLVTKQPAETTIISSNDTVNKQKEIKGPNKATNIAEKEKNKQLSTDDNSKNIIAEVPDKTGKLKEGDALISKYYSPYIDAQYRSSQDEMEKALRLYKSNMYDSAIIQFEKVLKIGVDNEKIDLALFYYSNAYLAKGLKHNDTGSLKKAKNYFLQFTRNAEFTFRDQSYWYLSIIYLKENKPDTARIILNKIVKRKIYNFQEASILLEKLK